MTFATNLVNHAQSLSFDGIDIDWESSINWAGTSLPSLFLSPPSTSTPLYSLFLIISHYFIISIVFSGMTRLAQKIRQLWPTVFLSLPVSIGQIKDVGSTNDPTHYLPVMPYLDAVNMMSCIPEKGAKERGRRE